MNLYLRQALVALVLSGLCFAQPSEGASAKKPHHGKKKAVAAKSATQEELKQLKEALAAQQQQLDALKQQNTNLDQQLKQTQQQVQSTQAAASEAQQKASALEAEQKPAVTKLQSDVADVKTNLTATTATVQKNEKRVNDLESPIAIRYKGVKLTPGGYVQVASIYRAHNANSDTPDNYGTYPISGTANSKLNEFRMSGRASRLSLKAEAAAKGMKFMGYWEMDFLGTTPNANESQTNSYAPRLRLAFGNVDLPGGWSIAGGQNWSLLQTNRKGIDPLTEWLPSLIDNSYTTGFSYARQGSIRVVKNIGNHAWFAVAAENPETTSNVTCVTTGGASCAIANVQGLQNSTITGSPLGSSFASTATPSLNNAPDLLAKVAIEPGWGHFEVKAVGRWFRDRVYANGTSAAGVNKVTEGGGLGFGAVLPIVPKKIDIAVQGLGGKGIGRYGVTGGPDVTLRPDGSLQPVKALQAIVGIETHPTPKLDFNVYGGDEYYGRTAYNVTGNTLLGPTTATIGYGAPNFVGSTCTAEFPTAATCQVANQNRNVWSVQPQLWYRLYKGKEGTVQFGASYAYTYRRTWNGVGTPTNGLLAIQNTVMTAFRYYLP